MSKKNKKKKVTIHCTYNKKQFLSPDSIRSMAAVHCKIKSDGIAMLRISDCNNTIRIWNDFNSYDEKLEFLEKIKTLRSALESLHLEVSSRITDRERIEPYEIMDVDYE